MERWGSGVAMRAKLKWLVPVALLLGLGALALSLVSAPFQVPATFPVLAPDEIGTAPAAGSSPELATFGTGCFWCTEAVFQQMKGAQKVESGYSGGSVPYPSYRLVCTGT